MIVGGLGKGDLNGGGAPRMGGGILMVDGILYMSAPDNAWAVDARDGTSSGTTIGNVAAAHIPGIAVWGCGTTTSISKSTTIT